MANIARAYEFPSAQTARSDKKEGKIYSSESFDCAPKTPAWDCKSCAKSCSFFYSLQCLWQNTLVHLLPGLAKYNAHTRFLVSTGIYIRVFGFSFALKATYIRVFFAMLSRVKKYKDTKNTLKIHSRYSISIKKNTRIDVKIHMRCMIRLGKYIRIFYFSLWFSECTYAFCHIPC